MSQQYQNSIGQRISIGDEVVYIGWTHYRYQGEFQGLTPSGQVRIALKGGKQMYQYKWSSGNKLYDRYDRRIWAIYPGALYIRKSDNTLITYQDWAKLSYNERYGEGYRDNLYERHPGILNDDYVEVTVPKIFNGPTGLQRTFKVV